MSNRGRRLGRPGRVTLERVQPAGGVEELQGGLKPASREDTFPFALASVVVSFVAFVVCYAKGYLLLYGDAVAHMGIARRIFDSRNPGLAQLGGVWLPLPHILMLPFIGNMEWWQNGLAGAWPSLGCYILSVIGMYRLTRRLMSPQWALVATMFYGLNPNLLYLATTAMTEPLFLAELIWLTLLAMECVAAIRAARIGQVAVRLVLLGLVIVAAVFTRYDGWIVGAAVWCVLTWELTQRRDVWRRVATPFLVFTLLAVAGPLSWLAYNHHYMHDALDFMRGPYSAAAIEKKTSPPGSRHYRGWHNPGWALLFYTRTAQLDTAFWETGFAVMAAALAGFVLVWRRGWVRVSTLLWVPLPFYVYSIAYGSVPIFIPQLWPHSYYNARYGMSLLPALVVFAVLALERLEVKWKTSLPVGARLLQPVTILLVVLSSIGMMYQIPLVLKEAKVNSVTRVAFEGSIAREIKSFPAGVPILMYNSEHIGAIQQAGIPLRQTLNEGDYDSWNAALDAPASKAAYVIAIAGDPVAQAVAEHPAGLTELTVLCTTGQKCARIYRSDLYTFSTAPR